MITYQDTACPIFSIPPNWGDAINITEDYGVLVRETLDTSESRTATRPRPLFGINYSTMQLTARETGYTKRILEQANALPCAVGLWQDQLLLTAAASVGMSFIQVDATAGSMFDVVPYLMIWSDFETFTTHRISIVSANSILLADPITTAFAIGSRVVPMVIGKLNKPATDHITDENGVFTVDFQEGFFSEGPILGYTIAGPDVEASESFEGELIGGPLL